MDENLINQYAFEMFSRTKIFEAEFKVFEAQERLDKYGKKDDTTSIIIQSQVVAAKKVVDELKSQLQRFKETKTN